MKILVISQEVWRDDKNGGNVLSNLFSGLDAEFAQIFCSAGNPSNNICKRYYQITDSMVINNILKRKTVGKILNYTNFPNDCDQGNNAVQENKKFYNFFRKYRFNIFIIIKEILWKLSKWKTKDLENFIINFEPDIIFAPCYGNHFMLNLTQYVSSLTGKPIISYIWDDNYSLKQFRFSPIYWINRFILRKNIRKTFKFYDLTYTMTEEQFKECKEAFNCNIKILKKGGCFSERKKINKTTHKPINLVYAGGIYLGRWRTLAKLAKVIKKLNKHEKKFILNIYTGNELTKKQKKILNDGKNCIVHKSVSQNELRKIYEEADIALHVESFDVKNRLTTRISFSTKIIDLLDSSCAVMAISWDKHSGYTYLKKEGAAICINKVKDIEKTLQYIDGNPEILSEYANKAFECGKKNHQINDIQKIIKTDFMRLYKENKYESTTN